MRHPARATPTSRSKRTIPPSRKAVAQPEPNGKATKADKNPAPEPKTPTAAEVKAELRRLKAEAEANERAVKATSVVGQFLATVGHERVRGDDSGALNKAAEVRGQARGETCTG